MDYKGGKDRDYKKNFIEEVQKIYNKFHFPKRFSILLYFCKMLFKTI